MASMTSTAMMASIFDLRIAREFDAPPSRVFKMWTTPEHFARWLGPKGYSAPSLAMDVRVGGALRGCIRSPEARDYWFSGIFREIVEPERLAFSFAWERGKRAGVETVVTVEFAAKGGGTVMSMRQTPFRSIEERDASYGGWCEEFDKLEVYMTKLRAR